MVGTAILHVTRCNTSIRLLIIRNPRQGGRFDLHFLLSISTAAAATASIILKVMSIFSRIHYYYDRVEEHLPVKPSKWDRKWKIAVICLALIFFIMALVAFALHDRVYNPLSNTNIH